MIKRDDFQKLKQLDRIEYRQQKKEIVDSYPCDAGNSFSNMIFPLLTFLIVIAIFIFLVSGRELLYVYGRGVEIICLVLLVFTIAGYVSDVFSVNRKNRKLKELDEEYFKFEVTPKK